MVSGRSRTDRGRERDIRRDTIWRGIVIVTHNIAQARRIADDAAFFSEGRLVEYGKAETLFTAPEKEETRSFLTGVCG